MDYRCILMPSGYVGIVRLFISNCRRRQWTIIVPSEDTDVFKHLLFEQRIQKWSCRRYCYATKYYCSFIRFQQVLELRIPKWRYPIPIVFQDGFYMYMGFSV